MRRPIPKYLSQHKRTKYEFMAEHHFVITIAIIGLALYFLGWVL